MFLPALRAFCICFVLLLFAQLPILAQVFDWTTSGGSVRFNEITCLDTGSDGNLFAAGYVIAPIVVTDTLSGADTLIVETDTLFTPDMQLLSFDTDGNVNWEKTIPGTGNDRATQLAATPNGKFFVSGTFTDTLYFETDTLGTSGISQSQVFVGLINGSGNTQWAIQTNGTGNANATALTTNAAGEAILGLNFTDTLIVQSDTITALSNSNFLIVKLNDAGQVLWQQTGNGNGNVTLTALSTDAAGNIYACGYFTGYIALGNILYYAADQTDAFIAKIQNNGNMAWLQTLPATANQSFNAITIGPNNELYVSGHFNESFVWNADTIHAIGGNTAFVASFLPDDGTLLWLTTLGGQGITTAQCLHTDDEGNAWVSGNFTQSLFLNADTLAAKGAEDIFVWQVLPNGNTQWLYTTGGAYAETNNACTFDPNGNLYLAGGFDTQTIFETDTLVSQGEYDYFLVRMGASIIASVAPPPVYGNLSAALTVGLYPNPANTIANVVLPQTAEQLQLTLTDISGKIWLQQKVSGGQTLPISVSHLPKGLYMLYLRDYTQQAVVKLVIW